MNNMFYIVACAPSEEGGIYRYERRENGKLELLGFNRIENANWIEYSADRKHLYSTCTVGDSSGVAAFKLNADGTLAELNRMSAEGKAGCYVVADPSGKFLFCANYLSGSVSIFALNEDGSIRERLRNIQHVGDGPNKPRQDGPHTHFTNITPDGKYLIVIDLGIDAIRLYPFDPVKGVDEDKAITTHIAPGTGPRHLVFDRSGKIAYLIHELGNLVTSLAYSDGKFEALNTVSTLPADFEGTTKAAAIRLSEDERFLFASNRGYDSIAVFELDGKGGIKPHDLVLTGGSSPSTTASRRSTSSRTIRRRTSPSRTWICVFVRSTARSVPTATCRNLPLRSFCAMRKICFCATYASTGPIPIQVSQLR